MTPTSQLAGVRLRAVLALHEIRPGDLAAELGVDPSAVSRWMRGERAVPARALTAAYRMAEARALEAARR